MRACVRACVRTCVRACVRVCVLCVCVFVFEHELVHLKTANVQKPILIS